MTGLFILRSRNSLELGERDIGLFIFRAHPLFDLLGQRLEGPIETRTGEHGFLYIVRHPSAVSYRVEALPITAEVDLMSLNRMYDLDGVAP